MYELPRSLKEIQPKHQGNEHVDIFGAKNSSCVFVKNPESQPAGDYTNVFQRRCDDAYDKYQESVKRPSSSYKNPATFRDDKYTFDSEWCNPKFEHQKTLVNEQANFAQNYHHQRRLDQYSSSIFVSEEEKQKLKRVYEKHHHQTEATRNPNQNANFGRRSTLVKEYDDDQNEMRKAMPNYSNLFGLGERNSKSSQQLPQQNVQPLIPHKMKWEQFDSVLQRGSKDEEVGGDFHKRRYYENMKSSMDTHNNYDGYMPSQQPPEDNSKNRNPIVVQPPATEIQPEFPTPQTVTYNQNSQKLANQLSASNLHSKKPARPASSARNSNANSKSTQITIVKGLTTKFSLPALAQQCKLHSILLAKFNNDIHQGGNTGRGMITVVPQKKYGLQNLCSWLRAQGLTIRIK